MGEEKSIVDEAKETFERIKAENDRAAQILSEQKELEARRILAGTSDGGKKETPKEETDEEYTRRIESEIKAGKYN